MAYAVVMSAFVLYSMAGPVLSQTVGTALVRHAPMINGSVHGSMQLMLAESVALNGGAAITGDLLIPGSPSVQLNGKPTFGGTIIGSGAATPSNHRVTLNGNARLGHLRTRTDAVPLPAVVAPTSPTGTRNVVINRKTDRPGNFQTLRNLALNGNVGQIVVPPGNYGDFTANGGSGFTLGVADATQPAVYSFQRLTLNGNSEFRVVGPVIVTVANGFSVNGPMGAESQPDWLDLRIATGSFTLNGNVSVYGYVTTPAGTVTINGGSRLVGGLASDRLVLNGNSTLRLIAPPLPNQPPVVSLTSPPNGGTFTAPAQIGLVASASDADGSLAKVEFFSGSTRLGEDAAAPYEYMWTDVAPGQYSLAARATDNTGATTDSVVVAITVNAANTAPTIAITSPTNHAVIAAPATVAIATQTADPDGSVLKVEFFEGTTKLGENETAPFGFVWPAVPAGTYALTARATDNAGATTRSESIEITVDAPPIAEAKSITTPAGVPVQVVLSGVDPEGQQLSFATATPPSHGALSGTPPILTYTPAATFSGSDSFTYTASDGISVSAPATVQIEVQAPAVPPTAQSGEAEVQVSSSVSFLLRGTDASGAALTFTIQQAPTLGTIHIEATSGQTAQCTYVAGANAGLDSFTFTVSNGPLSSSAATVKVRVVPPPPVADGPVGHAGGLIRDALTLEPLEGAIVRTRGVAGAVMSGADGRFMLPVSGFAGEPAQDLVLIYEAPGYIPAYRRLIAYPGVPITTDPVFLKHYDSKVSVIGPAGGNATNSAGDVVAEIPAGAASGNVPVQLTLYNAHRELPGHLPKSSQFTYAVDLAPDGATFSAPVTVKIANSLGFAANTPIPVGVFNPDTVRWEPESMGTVSADGGWVVFQVTHFSSRDANAPPDPKPADTDTKNTNDKQKDSKDEKLDPGVSIARGTYEADIDLPAYRTLGVDRTLKLRYKSEAASGILPFTAQATNGRWTPSPKARSFAVDIAGRNYQTTFAGEPDTEYGAYFGGARLDLSDLPSGLYPYQLSVTNLYPGTYATAAVFGGSPENDTGVPTREAVAATATTRSWLPWVNRTQSPFGAGWSVAGLSRLYFSPGSNQVMLDSGSGDWSVFQQKIGLYASTNIVNQFGSGTLFSVRRDYRGGLLIAHGTGVTRLSAQQQLDTLVSGVSGVYFVNYGSGGVAVMPGGIIDVAEAESGTLYVLARIDEPDAGSILQSTGLYRMDPGSSTFHPVATDLIAPTEVQIDSRSRIYVHDSSDDAIWRYSSGGIREKVCDGIYDFGGMQFDPQRERLYFASGEKMMYLAGDDNLVELVVDLPDHFGMGRPSLAINGDLQFATVEYVAGEYQGLVVRVSADGALIERTNTDLHSMSAWTTTRLGKSWAIVDSQNALVELRPTDGSSMALQHLGKRTLELRKEDEEWLLDDGLGNFSRYSAEGTLRATFDRNGNTTRYEYEADGRLARIVDPVGRTTAFAYNSQGKLARIDDPAGRSTTVEVDARGDLRTVTLPDGATKRFGYDSQHRIVEKSDGRGNRMTFTVDPDGTYTSIQYADGTTTGFEAQRPRALATADPIPGVNRGFDSGLPDRVSAEQPDVVIDSRGNRGGWTLDERGYLKSETNALGQTTSEGRDLRDRIIARTDARENTQRFTYDLAGNLTRVILPFVFNDEPRYDFEYDSLLNLPITLTDPNGVSTFLEYDEKGNLVRYTDAMGRDTTFTYNARGQVLTRTNPLGQTTSWTYGADGNVASMTDAAGATTTFTTDSAGRISGITDANGHATTLAYDAANRIIAVTAADGGIRRFTYDANGNRLTAMDPLGNVTRYEYDSTDQLIAITAPDNAVTRFVYDAMGNRTKLIDPLGHETTYGYDAANRLISVTDSLGRITRFTLDANGNRIAITDPLDRTTTTQYDALNRAVATEAPDGGITSLEFDPAGNLIALTDPLTHVTAWEYDAMNRVVKRTDPLERESTTVYDEAGRVASQTNARGQTLRFTYDAVGRPTALDLAGLDTITWTYDRVGNPLQVADNDSAVNTTYDAVNRPLDEQQSYGTVSSTYDLAGRRSEMRTGAGSVSYAYDALNRLTAITDHAARGYSFTHDLAGRLTRVDYPNGTASTLAYDAADQLIEKLHVGGGTLFGENTYVHNAGGNIEGWGSSDGNTRTFTYDRNDRLLSANSSLPAVGSEAFAYDLVGNWTPYDGRVHNAANELVEDARYSYTYDRDGNLTEQRSKTNASEVTTYEWDPLNRLVRVITPLHTVAYRYDGFGRRTAKSVDGVETRYVLDRRNVVEERNGLGGLAAFNLHAGLDVLLMRQDYSAGATYWTHTDHLGSIEALTDATGSIIERYRYTAFGRPMVLGADHTPLTKQPLIPYAFTAREWEPETGLHFYRARSMDPRLGRWLSMDPIGQSGGLNLYSYVDGNPINAIDPLGLFMGTPLSAGEWFGSVVSGAGEGLFYAGKGLATAPYRLGQTVISGYEQMGGLAGDMIVDPTFFRDLRNMAENPWQTTKATGEAFADMGHAVAQDVKCKSQTSEGRGELWGDVAFAAFSGVAMRYPNYSVGWRGGELTFTPPGARSPSVRINPTGGSGYPPHYHRRPGIGKHRPWQQ